MTLALLLAQLVLPSPPSGPIQPPGMICVGECEGGPAVYRTSGRGKLVVACDMTSDTCSDGRKITTERATPVPCETSPGVWEIVPEDTACISYRGRESWAQTTSCLSWGAELDRSPWGPRGGGSLETLPDGYRIRPREGTPNSGWGQAGGSAPETATYTASCIVRTFEPTPLRYWIGPDSGVTFPAVDTRGEWQVVTAARTINAGRAEGMSITGADSSSEPKSIDVRACWLTKTDTPGRACWGGEAPVTCAADQHTISTEGWPTEAGEISVTFSVPPAGVSGSSRLILDSRLAAVGTYFRVSSANNLQANISGIGLVTIAPVEPREDPYVLRVVVSDGTIRFYLDGVEGNSREGAFVWAETASLGSTGSMTDHLNGSISSLRVRSYE